MLRFYYWKSHDTLCFRIKCVVTDQRLPSTFFDYIYEDTIFHLENSIVSWFFGLLSVHNVLQHILDIAKYLNHIDFCSILHV